MKRTIIAAIVAVLSLSACGGTDSTTTTASDTGSTGSTAITSCPSSSSWHMVGNLTQNTCPASAFVIGQRVEDIAITAGGPTGPIGWSDGAGGDYSATVPAGYENGCGIRAVSSAASTSGNVTVTVSIQHDVNLGGGTGTTTVSIDIPGVAGYPCAANYSDVLTRE